MSSELEATVGKESRQKWNETNEKISQDINSSETPAQEQNDETPTDSDDNNNEN
jgi:hypothetical protein